MTWLLRDNWLGSLLAFFLGAAITWLLLDRRTPAHPTPPAPATPGAVPAAPTDSTPTARATLAKPEAEERVPSAATPAPLSSPVKPVGFSELMGGEPTLFDELRAAPEEKLGRYGEGSADAVPHQGPPDGFTIKGNAQSMLFHTPDSPYYGRTKPEVWFRTEADAERAGFTKYVRRPRKSANPRD